MRNYLIIICLYFCYPALWTSADVIKDLTALMGENPLFFYQGKTVDTKSLFSTQKGKHLLQKPLSSADTQKVSDFFFHTYQSELKKNFGPQWGKRELLKGELKMPFETRISGEKTVEGRSLYISMHGGGNAPSQMNNQQWRNQVLLYTPEEGVYIAPRAPFDDWDMWFRPEMDFFFDRLIQLAVIELDVNPNKVYLIGYSAGGDGVYRMAPRMADRWAATSMMAGHPGDVSPLNLRNIGFSLWVGGKDAAYDRNKKAHEFGQKLAEVRKADPLGYSHEVHILENKSHWMDLEDAVALPWMAKFRRNPLPEKIVWRQEESEAMPSSFYWVSIPPSCVRHKGDTLIISRQSNTFCIEKTDYPQITINLNEKLIDFTKPVRVVFGEKELFNEKVQRSIKSIYESIQTRGDQDYIFCAQIQVNTK